MVKLPDEFIATRYPGYFFNTKNETLYSLKVRGVLRPMKLLKPNPFNHMHEPFFRISNNGIQKSYPLSKLRKLAEQHKQNPKDTEIPVQ